MAISLKILERRGVALDPLPQGAPAGAQTGTHAIAHIMQPWVRARIQWLGQAGFLIDTPSTRLIIDPYLSNSLGVKYAGARFPHTRMMPVPVDPRDIRSLRVYLATHHHGDHLDPDTVTAVVMHNPDCAFIVPAASRTNAKLVAVPSGRIIGADAFVPLKLGPVEIYPIPSAHEELTIDGAGHHIFLGYVISIDGLTIYHSGDCAPYEGLVDNLSEFKIDVALLPVNGRDKARRDAGILGNFSLEEAVELARGAGFAHTIGHHFGMFDFNTIDVAEAERWLAGEKAQDNTLEKASDFQLALMDRTYELE